MAGKLWRRFMDVADDVLAYVLTVAGIILSNTLPALKAGGDIAVSLNPWRLAVAAAVALILVGKQEALDVDEAGSKDRSREGRRKRFWSRMGNALAQGMMWAQVSNLAV
jgi:hypothetical protein